MPTVKTSQSHPLQINEVAVSGTGGIIGLTFCPGKKHTGLFAGAWNRDLRVDLQKIHAFGATALVTLMESHELEKVAVPLGILKDQTRQLGLEWHHLPIKDVSTPDDRFEHAWGESGLRLRNILAAGGKNRSPLSWRTRPNRNRCRTLAGGVRRCPRNCYRQDSCRPSGKH